MGEVWKRRASGAPGVRFRATPVGRDATGSWLLVDPSTPHVNDVGGWLVFVSPSPVLLLVPDSGHWVASTSHTGAKVDLCRDISVGPNGVEFVDVEIDVVWKWARLRTSRTSTSSMRWACLRRTKRRT